MHNACSAKGFGSFKYAGISGGPGVTLTQFVGNDYLGRNQAMQRLHSVHLSFIQTIASVLASVLLGLGAVRSASAQPANDSCLFALPSA